MPGTTPPRPSASAPWGRRSSARSGCRGASWPLPPASEPTGVTAPALALAGIAKRYGTVAALDDAALTLRPGTVHALLGENGAGKTTLMRVAFGMVRPDAGQVRVEGRDVRLRS